MTEGPPAIFFHADAIESDGKELVGRRSAGQSFLRGFLQHMPGDEVRALVQHLGAAKEFDQVARKMGETRKIVARSLRGRQDFTEFGAIFFPGPGYMGASWQRQRFGPRRCSLVGITHTVSTRRVIEALHNLMLEPVEPWDAIICTSRAVQSVVQRQFEIEADFIRGRFGATRVPQPQLPVIPLGIQTVDFTQTADDRARIRAQMGVPEDAIVIMTMGRITSVEKANPVPLMIALEELAQTRGKPLHLWMAGWAKREEETELHRNAAAQVAPSIKMRLLDGRDPDLRRHLWAGADIFTLPVDNIQETFGLVPVEAMAAGLPVVMPDWNGFRDTIVHGETGFLVPTRTMGPGLMGGETLAARFADGTDDYLRYLSLIQQQTQIDLRQYVAFLGLLIENADLRRKMGAAGQRHARACFDWSAVIPQYLALSDELAAQRQAATPAAARPVNPIQINPFDLYQRYPSAHMTPQTIIRHRKLADADMLDQLDQVNGRALYKRRIMPNDQMAALSRMISEMGQVTVAELAHKRGQQPGPVISSVLFLAKYDFVTLADE